ncbi:unnamed protein product [Hermetia illucens]|uniref:Uncharacterized protein n=1 Tax=Hermetia illucens TaxID=343691 RepID=A0A7R8YWC0_HERIL|nr:protein D2-like [Hermetia illucens]CAD7086656.1 unnamed protein product [Hermetia illucens]
MEKYKIVPDVISKAPSQIAKVTFPSGVTASQGNQLKPRQVKAMPTVEWDAEPSKFYTICMTDPDAPSRRDPKFREWHHWLVGNIPGNNITEGDILSEYIGSAPPKGSGLHRYVILVYQQNGKINFNWKKLGNRSGNGRGKFSIRKFAEEHGLGDPVAGNFFQAEWDDYVAEVYKQLQG